MVLPEKVGLSFEVHLVCTFLLPLLQFSFNHLNEHLLCLNFSNLNKETDKNDDKTQRHWILGETVQDDNNTCTFPCGSLSSINCS